MSLFQRQQFRESERIYPGDIPVGSPINAQSGDWVDAPEGLSRLTPLCKVRVYVDRSERLYLYCRGEEGLLEYLKNSAEVEIQYKPGHELRFNLHTAGFQGKTHWARLQLGSVRKASEISGFTFNFYHQGLKLDFELRPQNSLENR